MGIEYISDTKCRLVAYSKSDEKGKPVRTIRTVSYTSKADAKRKYRKFLDEIEEGAEPAGKAMRLDDLMDQVLDSMQRKGLKETTLTGYRKIRRRINATLGNPKVKDVTPYMVDKWISELQERYAPKTVATTVSFLSACYRKAIRWDVASINPCTGAELPPIERKEKVTLDVNDVQPFFEALHKEEDKSFIVAVELALFCGLRRSEIFGLTNSSIDTEKAVIHVSRTRHRLKGGEDIIQGTKTKSSDRFLSLPAFLVDDIMSLQKDREEKRIDDVEYSDYLITNDFGEPCSPANFWHKLHVFEEKNNLPFVSPHGLRHTYASMMNYFGRDLVEISNQLGHASKSITLDVYTHLFEDASHVSREIASDVDNFVHKKE